MADLVCRKYTDPGGPWSGFNSSDGTHYFHWAVLTYRRGNQFGGGTITVTAYAGAGSCSDPNIHMEVV